MTDEFDQDEQWLAARFASVNDTDRTRRWNDDGNDSGPSRARSFWTPAAAFAVAAAFVAVGIAAGLHRGPPVSAPGTRVSGAVPATSAEPRVSGQTPEPPPTIAPAPGGAFSIVFSGSLTGQVTHAIPVTYCKPGEAQIAMLLPDGNTVFLHFHNLKTGAQALGQYSGEASADVVWVGTPNTLVDQYRGWITLDDPNPSGTATLDSSGTSGTVNATLFGDKAVNAKTTVTVVGSFRC